MKKFALFSSLALAGMLASAPLAAAMRTFDRELPAFSGHARVAKSKIERDGFGRRLKPKVHPKHNSRRTALSFADFRRKVEATHSFNADPREDKYLHSHARKMRHLSIALGSRAA